MLGQARFTPFARCALAALALTAGCSDTTGPGGSGQGRLSLSVMATAGGFAAGPVGAALGSETIVLGGNTLVIERVRLVLREIELKRDEDTADCRGTSDDDCEEFEVGPILLDLPLGAGPERIVTIDADAGTFEELEFEIHKPDDDDDDADRAFLLANPDFARVSIRVEGTYNGQAFVFISDLNAEQEFDLVPPLLIEAGASVDLTLLVDLGAWFLNASATTVVNPATANKGGPNEGLVEENIKDSFEAFEDDDHDGRRG